jgi:hypothetical protein
LKIKGICIGLTLLLILSSFVSISYGFQTQEKILTDEILISNRIMAPLDTHHTVLGEQGTSTTCQYCPSAAKYIAMVTGDFYYVALVTNKNTFASQRASELGVTGVPDIHFDGGYRHVLGGQSSPTNYQNAYNSCQSRTVADVDITMFVKWLDNAQMEIKVIVDNTGGTNYNGHLHVYITEKISRWFDYDGIPYKNAMIGYGFNQDITVNSGQSWSDTRVWDGNQYGFGNIVMDNIFVVASVFSRSTMYVDETTAAEPGTGGGGGDDGAILPTCTITSPDQDEQVEGIIDITGIAHHPYDDGDLDWVMIQIDDESWQMADGTVDWTYEWNSNTVEDGIHSISAISSDGTNQSGTAYITFEVNNIPDPPTNPDLSASGQLNWVDVKAGFGVEGSFTIKNIGDPNSLLDWEITEIPTWGQWTISPTSGDNLKPEDGNINIDVYVIAPDEEQQNFNGEIKIVNTEDPNDYEIIDISLATPQIKNNQIMHKIIHHIINNHPFLANLLCQIFF